MNDLTILYISLPLVLCIFTFLFYKTKISDLKKRHEDVLSVMTKDQCSMEEHYFNTISNLKETSSLERDSIEKKEKELQEKEVLFVNKITELENKLSEESENRKKVVSQKKSSEVRLGHIAETLAPFLDQFDFEPENCCFLGKPIDYISFGDKEITFIEVKSGQSQLSSKQKYIKDLVESKKVSWKEVRIK